MREVILQNGMDGARLRYFFVKFFFVVIAVGNYCPVTILKFHSLPTYLWNFTVEIYYSALPWAESRWSIIDGVSLVLAILSIDILHF